MTQLDMVKPESRLFERVSAFLGREAGLLDSRDWHEWLALFAPDAKYWAPAWVDDHKMTSDPTRQANLIYADRTELEARIFRIEGEDSYASMPLPHTSHVITCTGVQKPPAAWSRPRPIGWCTISGEPKAASCVPAATNTTFAKTATHSRSC